MIKKGKSKIKVKIINFFRKVKMKFMSLTFNEKLNSSIALLSLLIAIASLIIAIVAISSITKIEGFDDLLNKTTQNNTQITIAIEELKKQNEKQQLSLENFEKEINELKLQTEYLIKLQKASTAQLLIQQRQDISNTIKDALSIYNLEFKIRDMMFIQDNYMYFDKSYRKQTLTYLNDLKALVNEGVNNNLLSRYENIYTFWIAFKEQIETTMYFLNVYEENLITKYYNIPPTIKNASINGETPPPYSAEKSAQFNLKAFKEYSKTFYDNGVLKARDILEVEKYAAKFYSLTFIRQLKKENESLK